MVSQVRGLMLVVRPVPDPISVRGMGVTSLDGNEWLAHPGSVGRPLYGAVKVLDSQREAVAAGDIGEIFFYPPAALGSASFDYIGAEVRQGPDNSVSLCDEGWLDEEGFLYLVGRRTDLILSGGANVYPAEIESVLSACAGVEAVVVVGLPDEDLGERVHAIVQLSDVDHPPSEGDLALVAAQQLARGKRPRSYEFVTEPLRDAAGKMRRSHLRDQRITALPKIAE